MAESTLDVKPPSATESSPAATGATAASPTAKQDDKSLSDIVKEAADASKATEGDPAPSTETGATKPEGVEEEPAKPGEEAGDTEEIEVEPAEVPFHNHPRWKEVLKERDSMKTENETLKPKAEGWDTLSKYCESNGLSQVDVQEALKLAALSRSDIPTFRKKMQEYLDGIDYAMGTRLPPDVQKKLDDGVIDDETAKEIASARIRLQQSEHNTRTTAAESAKSLNSNIMAGMDAWESSQRKADPDFDIRRESLKDRFTALCMDNPPRSVQEAIKLVEQANMEVKKRYSSLQPRAKAPRRAPLGSQGSSATNGEVLKLDNLDTDLLSIVQSVARKHR